MERHSPILHRRRLPLGELQDATPRPDQSSQQRKGNAGRQSERERERARARKRKSGRGEKERGREKGLSGLCRERGKEGGRRGRQ
jgi:hypothetical protein